MIGLNHCLFAVFAFAAICSAIRPAHAKNIGADPPLRCSCGCAECGNGPSANCSSLEACVSGGCSSNTSGNCSTSQSAYSGTCFSRTEGNEKETYAVVSVRSSNGTQLSLSLVYDSYNADTSRARLNTVLGLGWTHTYNAFLYTVRGNMFRVDGEGRITKYQLNAGGTYTAAPGYFETIVKNPDGSFVITKKNKTAYHYVQVASTPFMQGTPVWRLLSITDRNNNVTALTYSGGRTSLHLLATRSAESPRLPMTLRGPSWFASLILAERPSNTTITDSGRSAAGPTRMVGSFSTPTTTASRAALAMEPAKRISQCRTPPIGRPTQRSSPSILCGNTFRAPRARRTAEAMSGSTTTICMAT